MILWLVFSDSYQKAPNVYEQHGAVEWYESKMYSYYKNVLEKKATLERQ